MRVESIEPSLACNQLYTERVASLSLSQSAAQVTSSRTTSSVDTVAKGQFYTSCKVPKAQNKYQEPIDRPRKLPLVKTSPSIPIKPIQASTRSAQFKNDSSSNIRHRKLHISVEY